MRSPALPILFLILHLAAGASAAPSYVVAAPAVMYHPYPATLWVHLSGLSEHVQVTIELQRRDRTQPITVLKTEVQEHQVHLNVTFPTPAPTSGSAEYVDLSISIHGSSLNVSEKKVVILKTMEPGIFIQTDKALYKPGQQVKFRVVSLNKDFIPSNEKGADAMYPYVQDPHGNRIAQWRDVSPRQGIVDLSLPLATEPALGTYTIHVEGKTHSFSVEEYVMPKFEVTINLPSVVLEQDKKFQMEICGRYTYGKPVHGSVQASLCHQPRLHISEEKTCTNISGKTEKNGCFSTEVLLSIFNMTQWMTRTLEVQASLAEDGTGLEMKSTKSTEILPQRFTVTFEYPNEVYKPGIPYNGTLLLKGANGTGVPQRQLLLSVSITGKEGQTHAIVTDGSGRAPFTLDTSGWSGRVSLKGEVNRTQNDDSTDSYRDAQMKLMPFYSESGSFLEIHQVKGELPCGKPYKLWADFIFSKEALKTELKIVDVVVLVVAKGTIATVLRKQLPAKAGVRDYFYLEVPISLELGPMAMALCYVVLPNGEMLADSMELYVAKCFPNKVKMAFSEDRALPGTALQLRLGAAPGSLCAIRAVDRSVLLLKPEAELSAEAIYKVLPEFRAPHRPWVPSPCDYYDDSPYMETYRLFKPCDKFLLQWGCSSCWQWEIDNLFCFSQGVALKLFTNAKTRRVCSERHYWFMFAKANGPTDGRTVFFTTARNVDNIQVSEGRTDSDTDDEEDLPAPRMYFPETWLWDLVPVGEGGSAEVTVTVPDAITEWKAQTFCTAPQGLGLSPATTLTAFQPFFVELALPYAVVRHETFTLVATVFNYLRQCLRVWVTLAESAGLKVSAGAEDEYGGCVCGQEAMTFRWGVQATRLGEVNITVSTEALSSTELCGNKLPVVPAQGRVDTVIKPLLVKPGGILMEKAHNSLLCQEDAKEVSLEVPANILEGSQRAYVTVMGDIIGNAMQNLGSLLAMPYGCGEQNMVRFAPNIYIQQYLEKSGQMLPNIRAKAQGFLQSGYQQELQYKHDDGSYSAFGNRDATGNTWLTAFVLKSFGQAKAFMSIEERHITDALRWLQGQQKPTGCFRRVGKLFNNALKGGVSDELSLSAYVTAAMLELGLPPVEPTVSSALKCLKASATNNPYTLALLAYVFGLAGLGEQQRAQLQSLDQHSVSAGGLLYWQRKGLPVPSSEPSWATAAPAEVEMTAYVLLAYLTQPQVSSADLATATQIVRWLCKQQNPHGGFASTQDTVVALQALAKYATLTFNSNGGSLTVTVTSPGGSTQDFLLDPSNRLVLQQEELHQLPGAYGLRAHGEGCALVQMTVRYNVPPPPNTGVFELRVRTEPLHLLCAKDHGKCFVLHLWARYTGTRPATNMIVIEAKLPSGYSPDKGSVVELKRQKLVKKVEVEPDQVTIYLDQLTKEEKTFSFSAKQDFVVENLQPATVTLYDYYETGERVDVSYSAPLSS
ncbi:A2ML1 protein, partial [Sclerurus mexicanus]|nr:A2ML1 protein [Sclerurus mexicanus]